MPDLRDKGLMSVYQLCVFHFSADVKKPDSFESGFLQFEVGALRSRMFYFHIANGILSLAGARL
ncbi:hypothetical protein [Pseudoalteromonas sp. MMG007]|uniref:hypothetical protein n=1 Tax=Pseudoalteromonas sp. MMG007 TaxID=2822684 RepID=UPI001B37A1FA|nr:hypothetical protein [Pseudoalteromonas sp. MMG007]